MMPCLTFRSVLAAAALLAFTAIAASAPPITRDGALEKLALFDAAELKAWSTAESTVGVSSAHTRGAAVSLHWHVTVDHTTGEPKYPIGWPRVNRNFPAGPLRDWSAWDYLHGWIFVATYRAALPGTPAGLGLHTPDRAGAYQRPLAELKAGEWVELNLPIASIPRHHDVRQIQFHIAEANYRHGDALDFYFSDLALLRHAAPTLLAFAPESAVLFADAKHLSVRLHLAGVATGQSVAVRCELWRNGRVVAHASVPATRGVQTASFALAPSPLPTGEYELHASLPGQTVPASARLRLVDSPWK
jgi:hypothetical protein